MDGADQNVEIVRVNQLLDVNKKNGCRRADSSDSLKSIKADK